MYIRTVTVSLLHICRAQRDKVPEGLSAQEAEQFEVCCIDFAVYRIIG